MADVFDGSSFLKDNGLTLLDVGTKPGMVRVMDTLGQEQELDMRAQLGADAPKDLQFEFNDPSTALNKSPVDFTDRLKLSLGNATGQVNYLKNKYESATINENGDLLVKDKGAWYTVDPTGLGNGEGWDIAGDLADLAKDAMLAVGQVGGTALGALAGGGVASVPAAAAASAAGSMVASSGAAALGRILGTYQATPEEMIKDVALDGILAAGGETIALGASKTILPSIKKAIANIAEMAEPGVKNIFAGALNQLAGVPQRSAERLLNRSAPVLAEVDSLLASAPKGFTQGDLMDIAAKRTVPKVAAVLQNAQGNISREYMSIINSGVNNTPSNWVGDLVTPLTETTQSLGEMGLLEWKNGSYVPASKEAISRSLGVAEGLAVDVRKKLTELHGTYNNLSRTAADLKGPEAVRATMQANKVFEELASDIIELNPEFKSTLSNISTGLSNKILAQLPAEVRESSAAAASFYKANIQAVAKAKRLVNSGDEAIQSFAQQLTSNPGKNSIQHQMVDQLSTRIKGGEEILNSMYDGFAANDFLSIIPRGAIGASLPRIAGAGAGFAVGGIPGAVAGFALTSPRVASRTIGAGVRSLSAFNATLRNVSPQSRVSLLKDPTLFGAAISEGLRSAEEDRARRSSSGM